MNPTLAFILGAVSYHFFLRFVGSKPRLRAAVNNFWVWLTEDFKHKEKSVPTYIDTHLPHARVKPHAEFAGQKS